MSIFKSENLFGNKNLKLNIINNVPEIIDPSLLKKLPAFWSKLFSLYLWDTYPKVLSDLLIFEVKKIENYLFCDWK